MSKLNGKQRNYLRKLSHVLNPIVSIGGNGLTDAIVSATVEALDSHELIKVKFQDFKAEKNAMAAELSKKTSSRLITVIGNIAVLYRRHSEEEKRKIIIPS